MISVLGSILILKALKLVFKTVLTCTSGGFTMSMSRELRSVLSMLPNTGYKKI